MTKTKFQDWLNRIIVKGRLAEHRFIVPARQMKKSIGEVIPALLLRLNRRKRRLLKESFARCATVQDSIEFTQQQMRFGSCQIAWEIELALRAMTDVRPEVLCEIGTLDGGTSLLFSKFLPSLKSLVCIDLYVRNKEMLRLLAPATQTVSFIDMPSYSERALKRVTEILNGRMIDILFIDGDHRYEGVKKDFLGYRSFVREGGLILFHDIIQDKGGSAWSGGVPRFWRELSAHYPSREIVRNRDQGGFGIGILTYSSKVQTF